MGANKKRKNVTTPEKNESKNQTNHSQIETKKSKNKAKSNNEIKQRAQNDSSESEDMEYYEDSEETYQKENYTIQNRQPQKTTAVQLETTLNIKKIQKIDKINNRTQMNHPLIKHQQTKIF